MFNDINVLRSFFRVGTSSSSFTNALGFTRPRIKSKKHNEVKIKNMVFIIVTPWYYSTYIM